MSYDCPECAGKLEEVRYPSDCILNYDQCASIRAGDYVCRSCEGDLGKSGMRYYWECELEDLVEE